jgi:hypothetical protein
MAAKANASAQSSDRNFPERMHTLFLGFSNAHGTHGEPELDDNGVKWSVKSTYQTRKEPPTVKLWELHLNGERPLAVAPIRDDGTCSWGCIEIDDYDINAQLMALRIYNEKLPLFPVISKSGGLRLYLFTQDPQRAELIINVLKAIAARLGHAKAEIFPKQTKILNGGDSASLLIMPYCPNTFGGKLHEQTGITQSGSTVDLGTWLDDVEDAKLTDEGFQELVKKYTRSRAPNATRHKNKNGHDKPAENFEDGPPCLENMAQQDEGFPAGQHNVALFNIATYEKKRGDGWEERVQDRNTIHELNQSPDDVKSIIGSHKNPQKTYFYQCKQEPLKSFCNSKECRRRPYGVGGGALVPTITGVIKVLTLPEPTYYVTVDGDIRIKCSYEQLRNYDLFTGIVGTMTDRVYQPENRASWYAYVDIALQSVETLEPPTDEKYQGSDINNIIQSWVTNAVGSRKEDMLRGTSWHDAEGETTPNGQAPDAKARYFFRLEDLWKHVGSQGQGAKQFSKQDLIKVIKQDYEGGKHFFNFLVGERRRGCQSFWIFESMLEPPEHPPIKQPRPEL